MAWVNNNTQQTQHEVEEEEGEEEEEEEEEEQVENDDNDDEQQEEEEEEQGNDDGEEHEEEEEEDDEGEDVEVDVEEIEKQFEDDDLFGPENEDYMQTTAQSRLPIPSLPHFPGKEDFRVAGGRNGQPFQKGGQKGTMPLRAPLGGGYRHQSPGKAGYLNTKEPLVAEMKLGSVGHHDETLRLKCPPFQEPCQIACYSRGSDGIVHFDDRCLRRFRRGIFKETGADLNHGFETFIEKQEDMESSGFGDLLACIRSSGIQLDNIHFVTYRNNLNKILGTTYNRHEPWEMGVHKRHGTVYLDVHKLPEHPKNELHLRSCYWGYSFEHLATEDPSAGRASTGNSHGASNGSIYDSSHSTIVNANVEYCTVIRTKLGPHRIVMGAEMDCYENNPDGRRSYIELKTSREIDARTMQTFERDKLLKFWIQSFLAGVPRIVCGFRDDAGKLVRTEVMSTKEITQRVKHRHYWEGGVCLSFADRVLCWLYGSIKENEDYVLRFLPKVNRLELRQIDHCPTIITEHLECFSQPQ